MGNHPGSSPGNRTTYTKIQSLKQGSVFLYFGIGGAVTGRVHRMTPQSGDIRCTRLRLWRTLTAIAVRQVPVTGTYTKIQGLVKGFVFLYFGIGGAVIGTIVKPECPL